MWTNRNIDTFCVPINTQLDHKVSQFQNQANSGSFHPNQGWLSHQPINYFLLDSCSLIAKSFLPSHFVVLQKKTYLLHVVLNKACCFNPSCFLQSFLISFWWQGMGSKATAKTMGQRHRQDAHWVPCFPVLVLNPRTWVSHSWIWVPLPVCSSPI